MNCSSPYSARVGGLVLALQRAVVPLVEPPRPAHRDPVPVGRAPAPARRCGSPGAAREVCSDVGQQAVLGAAARRRGAASAAPFSDRSTSTQPVNRFLAFHSLSPWRSSTRVPVAVTGAILPDRSGDGSVRLGVLDRSAARRARPRQMISPARAAARRCAWPSAVSRSTPRPRGDGRVGDGVGVDAGLERGLPGRSGDLLVARRDGDDRAAAGDGRRRRSSASTRRSSAQLSCSRAPARARCAGCAARPAPRRPTPGRWRR